MEGLIYVALRYPYRYDLNTTQILMPKGEASVSALAFKRGAGGGQ